MVIDPSREVPAELTTRRGIPDRWGVSTAGRGDNELTCTDGVERATGIEPA
jgi:hypothetical protein